MPVRVPAEATCDHCGKTLHRARGHEESRCHEPSDLLRSLRLARKTVRGCPSLRAIRGVPALRRPARFLERSTRSILGAPPKRAVRPRSPASTSARQTEASHAADPQPTIAGMSTIQRPAEAATALFWRSPQAALPPGTQLVISANDCVVASRNGAILGVIPPGSYDLGASSFPFLAPSADASSGVTTDLCFVRTSPYPGRRLNGTLKVTDPPSHLRVTLMVTCEYSLTVIDPLRFVQGSTKVANVEMVLAHVNAFVLQEMGVLYRALLAEGSALKAAASPRFSEQLRGWSGDIPSLGVSVQLGNFTLGFSEEDQKALVAAAAPGVAPAAAPAAAPAGVSAAPPVAGPVAMPAAAASPAPKSKTGLFVGLFAALVVLGVLVAAALHFTRGGSAEKDHDAPAHETKHGKH
jgi:hypothetical protein